MHENHNVSRAPDGQPKLPNSEHEDLQARVSVIESYLHDGTKPSSWQFHVGRVIHWLVLGIFWLQYFPWLQVIMSCALCCERCGIEVKPTTGNSNKFNLFHGFLEFLMYLGGVMNAVILTVLADAFLDNQIMEGASAYIAWFASMLLMNICCTIKRYRAADAVAAENEFTAFVLKVFDHRVRAIQDSMEGAEYVIFLLACGLPALLATFCIRFFDQLHQTYVTECQPSWSASTPGISFCNAAPSSLCCKVREDTFDITKFLAYLAGNFLSGYTIAKYAIYFELAYLSGRHNVEGGQVFEDHQPHTSEEIFSRITEDRLSEVNVNPVGDQHEPVVVHVATQQTRHKPAPTSVQHKDTPVI